MVTFARCGVSSMVTFATAGRCPDGGHRRQGTGHGSRGIHRFTTGSTPRLQRLTDFRRRKSCLVRHDTAAAKVTTGSTPPPRA